jgi:hypothetical protein
MSRDEPLVSAESAEYLARIINRAAASFDVAALSAEEAIEAYTLLDRVMDTLWQEHEQVLVPLYRSLLERRGVLEDDEPEDSGSTSH